MNGVNEEILSITHRKRLYCMMSIVYDEVLLNLCSPGNQVSDWNVHVLPANSHKIHTVVARRSLRPFE